MTSTIYRTVYNGSAAVAVVTAADGDFWPKTHCYHGRRGMRRIIVVIIITIIVIVTQWRRPSQRRVDIDCFNIRVIYVTMGTVIMIYELENRLTGSDKRPLSGGWRDFISVLFFSKLHTHTHTCTQTCIYI